MDGLATQIETQGFLHNIDADQSSKLDAIGHRLFRAIDMNWKPIGIMRLDPGCVSRWSHVHYLDERIIQFGFSGAARERDHDPMRDLRGQIVEVQGRDQANHRFGGALADLHQIGMGRQLDVGESVETTTFADDDTSVAHGI